MLGERLDRVDQAAVPVQAARELTEAMLDVIEHQIDLQIDVMREMLSAPA